MTVPIKFGTDGWRGIIADDFTFDNVRRVAGAIAAYVLKHEDPRRGLIVGYDTRFLFAAHSPVRGGILAEAGIPVKLANDYTPTPRDFFCGKATRRRWRRGYQHRVITRGTGME